MNPRRLYRSRDRQLAGVAGGMAEYLDVDPTVIRIAWILIAILSGGLALIAYLVLALVIPNSPYAMGVAPAAAPLWPSQPGATWSGQPGATWSGQPAPGTSWPSGQPYAPGAWAVPPATTQWAQGVPPSYAPARQTRGLGAAGIVGIVLVVIGMIALLDVVLPGLRFGLILGPAVILALGAALLIASIRRPVEPSPTASTATASPTSTQPDAASSAWSAVPADMTPWQATASPAQSTTPPTASPASQPDAPVMTTPATGTTTPAYDSDETKVDPI